MVPDSMAAALAHYAKGDRAAAAAACAALLEQKPQHFDALHLLGLLRLQAGQTAEAAALFRAALAQNPQSAQAEGHLGMALRAAHDFDGAATAFERAVTAKPHFPMAWEGWAAALSALHRYDDVIAVCDKALALTPTQSTVLDLQAGAYAALGRHQQAVALYDQLIVLNFNLPATYNSRGSALAALGRYDHAIASYDQAIALQPDQAALYYNRGLAFAQLKHPLDAIASYDIALALDPSLTNARASRSRAHTVLKRYDAAIEDAVVCLTQTPDAVEIAIDLQQLRQRVCDWSSFAADRTMILGLLDADVLLPPFIVSEITDDPRLLLRSARQYAAKLEGESRDRLWRGERYGHTKIRLAYIGGDFHEHPVAVLMADLISRHDRTRFEVFAVSHGPDDGSDARKRIVAAFDHFFDARGLTDHDIAAWIRAQEIDIAIDITGYTVEGRPNILAYRPAPVQVMYLANPGSTGASYIDYMIVDSFIAPPGLDDDYSEALVRLPPSLFPTDLHRAPATAIPTRAAMGLPDQAFVFCCFNNTAKILPETYDVWMRILSAVKDSVLWLRSDHPLAETNLRREAAARGVDSSRLIFAGRAAADFHLARHQLADLFLDTWPYNAGSTACDALLAGVPLLTHAGHTYVARMAGSVLMGANLQELITETADDYEKTAIRLARDPSALAAIRAQVKAARQASPLFNVDYLRRLIEGAYDVMNETFVLGGSPKSILMT